VGGQAQKRKNRAKLYRGRGGRGSPIVCFTLPNSNRSGVEGKKVTEPSQKRKSLVLKRGNWVGLRAECKKKGKNWRKRGVGVRGRKKSPEKGGAFQNSGGLQGSTIHLPWPRTSAQKKKKRGVWHREPLGGKKTFTGTEKQKERKRGSVSGKSPKC